MSNLIDAREKIKDMCGEERYSCSGCKWSCRLFVKDKYNLACLKDGELRQLVLVKDYGEEVRLIVPKAK